MIYGIANSANFIGAVEFILLLKDPLKIRQVIKYSLRVSVSLISIALEHCPKCCTSKSETIFCVLVIFNHNVFKISYEFFDVRFKRKRINVGFFYAIKQSLKNHGYHGDIF